jgi:histidinol-phosphate aminotransferase
MNISPLDYVCDLNTYQPGLPIELVARQHGLRPEQIIKLASNENPLGPSPKARAALSKATPDLHRYPDQYDLVQALAKKHKVNPECLVLGNGSNDVLDLVARTFLNAKREAISAQYGFVVFSIATQSTGAKNVIVPAKDYGLDLEAIAAAITPRTHVIWIANPNNPIGGFVPYDNLKRFLAKVPKRIVVVVDEAYYEYLEPKDQADATSWLTDYPNLVLTRTFSKIYGLAGLRVGYAITSPKIAGLLNGVRLPFNVSNLAIAAATAALDDDEFVQASYSLNLQGRRQLFTGLARLGLECPPAYGNFVTTRVKNAAKIYQKLLSQGIIVRPLSRYDLPDWLRITIGLPSENSRFLRTLERLI